MSKLPFMQVLTYLDAVAKYYMFIIYRINVALIVNGKVGHYPRRVP